MAMMAAVLHDVVEDTHFTFDQLREIGCPEEVLHVVELLTKSADDEYLDYVERILGNPTARKIKLADLEDNMNILRLSELTPRDTERLNSYIKAWRRLAY